MYICIYIYVLIYVTYVYVFMYMYMYLCICICGQPAGRAGGTGGCNGVAIPVWLGTKNTFLKKGMLDRAEPATQVKITYFMRKTKHSNMKFDIIDLNKLQFRTYFQFGLLIY